MTALCGGGTSGPNPIAEAIVLVTSARLAQIFETSGVPWLVAAVPFLTLPPFVLSTFCSSDPPAMPTFTSAEVNALNQGTIGSDFFSGLTKLAALATNGVWTSECICTSGSLTPPTYPTPPSGTAIVQQPQPTPTAPCLQQTRSAHTLVFNDNPLDLWGPPYTGRNVTSLHVVMTNATVVAPGQHISYQLDFGHGINTFTDGTYTVTVPPGVTLDHLLLVPPASEFFRTTKTAVDNNAGTTAIQETWSLFCGGQTPGGNITACCPPDATTQATLSAILGLVTLIQRQHVPFASIHGTAHTGLSGNGAIAVTGILGARVDVTTLPSRAGSELGDPVQRYDLGWINIGTSDGFGPRQFISSNPFLLEPVAGDATSIGYSIPGDVVITITELVREA